MSEYVKKENVISAIVENTTLTLEEMRKRVDEDPSFIGEWIGGLVDAVDSVEQLSPEPVRENIKGKWIPKVSRYYCNQCGGIAPKGIRWNFCPHCGAKMIQTDKTCDCYHNGRCTGTKEIDPCSCDGVKSKCDFYENVRQEGNAE